MQRRRVEVAADPSYVEQVGEVMRLLDLLATLGGGEDAREHDLGARVRARDRVVRDLEQLRVSLWPALGLVVRLGAGLVPDLPLVDRDVGRVVAIRVVRPKGAL